MNKLARKSLLALAAAGTFALAGLGSCGSKNKEASADSDSILAAEQAIDEEATAPDTLPSGYNAAFFNDESKKSATATDSTWTQTASGLKYAVVKEGTGKQPTANSEVTVHYTGILTNGYKFDSSVDRGEPATFPLNGVIPGWTEGLQLMKEGGKTVFYIPSALGYGSQGAPGAIPPDADLLFEVELIKVNS